MTETTQTDFARVRPVLAFDALTCLAAGTLMTVATGPLAELTALSPDLLRIAGIALFPVTALFAFMARTARLNRGLIQLAVIGNLAWVVASIVVLFAGGGNLVGNAFVAVQALAVAGLALLEARDGFGPIATARRQMC